MSYEIDHLSCTQMDMYLRCPAQWKYRYVEGLKKPPGVALVVGSSHDDVCNTVYENKIETGETLPANDCADIFVATFDERKEEVEDWGEHKPGAIIDQFSTIERLWRDKLAVPTKPVEVQKQFSISMGYEDYEAVDFLTQFLFVGVVDLVREELALDGKPPRIVVDNKTCARTYSARDVNAEIQPIAYALAEDTEGSRAIFATAKPLLPDRSDIRFEYHLAVKTKTPAVKGPDDTPHLARNVTVDERNKFVDRVVTAHKVMSAAVEADAFPPNRKSMMCSKRHCGFWQECEKDWGGSVPD